MDIEQLATSSIVTSVSRTKYLTSSINTGDKEPSWDGNIYVYNNENKKKSCLAGRVPVQVKGMSESDLSRLEITYPVNISDLSNYKNDGGTVYFVVKINAKGDSRIYYASLLPFNINQLLYNAGDQKSVTITLFAFPDDNIEKCNIFFNFIQDRLNQASSLDNRILSLNDASKIDNISGFCIGYSGIGYDKANPLKYLFNRGMFIYAMPKGFDIKIPVDYICQIESVNTTIEKPIRVGDVQLYNSYEVFEKIDRREIHFGKSFILTLLKTGEGKFSFKIDGTLSEQLVDISFLSALLTHKEIYFGNLKLPFSPTYQELKVVNPIALNEQLEYLRTIQKVLNKLKVKADLNYSKITNDDSRSIDALIASILYKESVTLKCDDKEIPIIATIQIANLSLLLMFCKSDGERYILKDFFTEDAGCLCENEEGLSWDTSAYTILKRTDFVSISNLNYDAICHSLFSVADSEMFQAQVSILLLEMLHAYDMGTLDKDELLNAIIRIAEWQRKKADHFPEDYATINYLQAIIRSRELKESEIDALCQITEQVGQEEDILVGAYLLQGNQKAAKLHFSRLSEERRKEFANFPIYHFWND